MQTGNKINLLSLGGHILRQSILGFILKLGLDSPFNITVLLYNDYTHTN